MSVFLTNVCVCFQPLLCCIGPFIPPFAITHCLSYCTFMLISQGVNPLFCFSFKLSWLFFGPLFYHENFRINFFFNSLKNPHWNFDWDWIDSWNWAELIWSISGRLLFSVIMEFSSSGIIILTCCFTYLKKFCFSCIIKTFTHFFVQFILEYSTVFCSYKW